MATNPFSVRWLAGWTFQTLFMDGQVQVEAHGFGICLRTPVLPGESPLTAADRLVLAEDRRRRALHSAWLRDGRLPAGGDAPALTGAKPETDLQPIDTEEFQPLIRVAA
jgi:hypothetical protein